MKKLIFILMILPSVFLVYGQDYEIEFASGTIEILNFSNITVEGYDGDKVLINEYFQENFSPDQEKGLRKINSRAPKLDQVLKHKIKGKKLILTEEYSMGSFLIKVPKNLNILCLGEKLHPYGNRNNSYVIRNIDGEIEVRAMDMVNVELENNTGRASVVTHGNISAIYESLPSEGLLSFDTYRG